MGDGRLAGGDVDGAQRARARWRSASSRPAPAAPRRCVMPPSVPPERPRRAPDAVVGRRRSRRGPASRGVAASSKPSPTSTPLIAWMPISAPASRASSRRSQCTCEPRPGRQPVHDDLDDAAEGVAVLVGLVDLGDHRRAGVRVEAAHRVGVERARRRRAPGTDAVRAPRPSPMRDDVARRPRAPTACSRNAAATAPSATRAAVSRARGPLQDRPGLVEVVLLHADQVGVPGPRAGSAARCGPAPASSSASTGSAAITCLPLGPLGVADPDRDRAAQGRAVPDAAEERRPRPARTSSGRRGRSRAGAGPARRRCRRW